MIEEAIKKSIEGGFENHLLELRKYIPEDDILQLEGLHDYFFLKPEFWQCLCGDALTEWVKEVDGDLVEMLVAEKWKVEWHKFIEHLSEGGTPDQFFTDLLAHKKEV